jgi:acyl-CoA hydrolase
MGGKVTVVGNTSITLYMEARAHNVYSGTQSVILHTNMRFVRIDEAGDPLPIGDRTRNKYNNNGESNI